MNNEEITRKEMKRYVEKKSLGVFNKLIIISMAAMFTSPFIWIWHSWYLAWRVGLSGLLLVVIFTIIYKILEKAISDLVDNEIEKMSIKKKSPFAEKLEKAIRESEMKRLQN